MFGFTFLFSPAFFWGGMSFACPTGSAPGVDGGAGLGGPGPPGALCADWISVHGLPSPAPLGGAGRAKQRKELTRREDAGGLSTEAPGVSPFPLPCPGARRLGARPETGPSQRRKTSEKLFLFFVFNQK